MKKSLNRRITIYFLIIMLLTGFISVSWNYYSTRQAILDIEKTQAEGCSTAIFSLLDHYGGALKEGQEQETYSFLWHAIRNYCRSFSQEAQYIYTVEDETDSRRVLLSVSSKDESRLPSRNNMLDLPVSASQMTEAETALVSGDSQLQRVISRTRYGATILWITYYPGSNALGPAFICMEYNIHSENGLIFRDFLADILTPIIALGIAFLILMLMMNRRVVKPIHLISDRMNRFAGNSREIPAPLHIPYKDEIGEIASSFEAMAKEISTYISNIENLTKERVENNVQLEIARNIQYGFVPEKTILNDKTFLISAMTRPAKGIGGDFYDCFRRDDGAICIVMGDVSGKGITGAIFMSVIKTIIREKLQADLSPAQTLNEANRELTEQNPEGLFATVFAAILNPDTGDLQYANAAHTYPVLLGTEATLMKPKVGFAIGMFDDAEVVDETMNLGQGEGIVLYTDGLTEAINSQGVFFGTDRLMESLSEKPDAQNPAEDVMERIRAKVDAFGNGVEPFDDMAILVLFRTNQS